MVENKGQIPFDGGKLTSVYQVKVVDGDSSFDHTIDGANVTPESCLVLLRSKAVVAIYRRWDRVEFSKSLTVIEEG